MATTIVDAVTAAACTDTTTPPGRVRRPKRANAQALEGIFGNPFLTPPEAFVKD
jgi:hypothetical protein